MFIDVSSLVLSFLTLISPKYSLKFFLYKICGGHKSFLWGLRASVELSVLTTPLGFKGRVKHIVKQEPTSLEQPAGDDAILHTGGKTEVK